jgi:hypothetical protein
LFSSSSGIFLSFLLQMIELSRPELPPEASPLALSDTRLGSDAPLSQRSSQSQVEPIGAMVKSPHQIDATVGCTSVVLEQIAPATCYRFRVRTANPAGKSR